MKSTVHVEIVKSSNCKVTSKELEQLVLHELEFIGHVSPGDSLLPSVFHSDVLKENIISIKFDESPILLCSNEYKSENSKTVPLDDVCLQFHTYNLDEEEIQSETLNITDGESESISAANYCLLPHASFHNIWENLIFDDNIKESLLDYASTSVVFSQHKVDTNVICWNKVILLYGPPGTGKTSLCKGLAQKLSIRLKKHYRIAEFIEINSHSLFSKYYSESGKLVMRMFLKIKEHLEYGESLVFVLIDEIESLTHARNACMTGAEPSDSIRVVNAILTQLDQIRKYPNVLILTTSNLKQAIDLAFVDRADLQIYVGPPSSRAIYDIFISCLQELVKVKIINAEKEISFLPITYVLENSEKYKDKEPSIQLAKLAKSCEGMSGRILRKFPFLAYSFFSKNEEKSVLNYIEALKLAVNYHRLNSNRSDNFLQCA